MKLSFIVLVYFMSVVAGSRPSPAKPAGHAAQKHNVEHSSSATRTPSKHHPISGKLGNANSGKDGRTSQQQKNAVQRTLPAPKLDLSTQKSGKSSSGKDGRTHQQKTVMQPTRSPTLNHSAGKLGNKTRGSIGQSHQQQNASQHKFSLKPSSAEKQTNSTSSRIGRTHQQQTVIQPTRFPILNHPAGKSGNKTSGIVGQTHQQQNASQHKFSLKPSSAEKQTNSTSSRIGRTHQQQTVTQPTRSPILNHPAGKLGNKTSGIVGQTHQQQNASQHNSFLKPASAEKQSNSTSSRIGKTHQQQTVTQPAPTRSSNLIASAGKSKTLIKSGHTTSGEVEKIQQKKKTGQYRLTSTLKPSTTEKSNNVKSANDGRISQQQNVSQHTSILKPHSAEKSGITSSVQVGETPKQQNNPSPKIEIYHHYYFSPPQQIRYGSIFHPVFQGHPPVYVYEYRDSGSRFDSLLTGLALYNLGRNSHFHNYGPDRRYSSAPGEVCKLRISKGPVDHEETRIDCNLMSSFIWDDTTSTTRNKQHVVKNTTQVTVTQTVNRTGNSSVSTVTTPSNSVEDALIVKGPSIQVTPGMTCYLIKTSRDTTTLRRSVDCGLLQEYARSSLHRSVAQSLSPLKTIILNFLFIIYWLKNI